MEPRISVHCVCGKVSEVSRKHIGKTLTCPHCGIARIKITDPDDSPAAEHKVQPLDGHYVPLRNQRAADLSLAESAGGTTTSNGQLWHLNVICCLLAIIAGIMVYNQFSEFVYEMLTNLQKWILT